MTPPLPRMEIDGLPVSAEAQQMLEGNFGHFTAMQVRDRHTRGLDLHLQRLHAATEELFGTALDAGRVREQIRHALGEDIIDASVRVYVTRPDPNRDVSIRVTVKPPGEPPRSPQRLLAVGYQRPVAHIKHSTGWDQDYYRRLALSKGFDEALFTGTEGAISEGGITNIGFLQGSTVVWPDAPALAGIMMQVIQRGLAATGVPWRRKPVHLDDLATYDAAFVTNSRGFAAVEAIDDLALPISTRLMETLAQVYDAAGWDPI